MTKQGTINLLAQASAWCGGHLEDGDGVHNVDVSRCRVTIQVDARAFDRAAGGAEIRSEHHRSYVYLSAFDDPVLLTAFVILREG